MGIFNMSEKKALVKQDINFLEYPLWNIDRQDKKNIFTIPARNGGA